MIPKFLQPVAFTSESNSKKIGLYIGTAELHGHEHWKLLNVDGSIDLVDPLMKAVPCQNIDDLPDADELLDCLYFGFMKRVSLDQCSRFVNIVEAILLATRKNTLGRDKSQTTDVNTNQPIIDHSLIDEKMLKRGW